MPNESCIAILGPGLLGGSLALAVRKHLPGVPVRVWGRRPEAVEEVLKRGIADFASTDAGAVVDGASFVILATPVPVMRSLSEAFLSQLSKDAVVTDVGSVKGVVVEALEPLFASVGVPFVGSHPMAGSDQSGLDAATDSLFERATCLITPTNATDASAQSRVEQFWNALGSKVLRISLADHDRKVARISHMPHAAAFALVRAALQDDPSAVDCIGNGFRDATRIAASDPELWTGILLENQAEVVAGLAELTAQVQEVLDLVRTGDKENLRRFIAGAQRLRATVPASAPPHGND